MGQKEAGKQDSAAGDSGVQKNLFSYGASAHTIEALERTQVNKFGTKGGTGFAAEEANALTDKFNGVKVDQVGTNNAKNGADRTANGVHIQTKYFDSAARTVNDAFDPVTKMYRYEGMQLEVPSDQYDKAVELMREKIAAGRVPDVHNPDEAINIVKKGSVTYQQARNIARAGTVESLKFDAKNNAVSSAYAFAIGFGISFARGKWTGKSNKEALKESLRMGLFSAGTSFIAGVATSQLLRMEFARKATVVVREGVREVAKTDWGRIIVDKVASASAGKPLSGAASTNHVSKVLRSNAIAGVVTTVVLSGPDVYRAAIAKNASWAQAGKNLLVNGAGVAAGSAGWMGGAAAGAALGSAVPIIGTAAGAIAGGIIGSLAAGTGGSLLAKRALDFVIDDDGKEMRHIIESELAVLADEFLFTQAEFEMLMEEASKECTEGFLREMYASDMRETFVRVCFEPTFERIARARPPIVLPAPEEVQEILDDVVAEIDAEAAGQGDASYEPNFVMFGRDDLGGTGRVAAHQSVDPRNFADALDVKRKLSGPLGWLF